jgi:hypothetical protein
MVFLSLGKLVVHNEGSWLCQFCTYVDDIGSLYGVLTFASGVSHATPMVLTHKICFAFLIVLLVCARLYCIFFLGFYVDPLMAHFHKVAIAQQSRF